MVGISLAVPAIVVGAAAAQDGGAGVMASGWAWQAQRQGAPDLGSLSGVPAGDVAVAAAGQPDKITYLAVDAGAVRAGRPTLRLLLDPAAPQVGAESAPLRACLLVTPWQPGAPMAWDTRPLSSCEDAPEGTFSENPPAFTFDVSGLAADLGSDTVHGLSVEPAGDGSGLFQVVFIGAERGGITLEGGAVPLPAPGAAPAPAATAPPPSGFAGLGARGPASSPALGTNAGVAGPGPPAASGPTGSGASPARAQPVASGRRPTTAGITAGLGLLAVLAVVPRLAAAPKGPLP